MTEDWVGDVEALHRKFGSLRGRVSMMADDDLKRFWQFRLDFLAEELLELERAKTPADAVDAIIDLCVVAIGTLEAFGVDAREAWRQVHAANVVKDPGENPNRPNPFGLPDLIKPPGWSPPDHSNNVGIIPRVFPKEE